MIVVAVRQNARRLPLRILELAVAKQPEEGDEADASEQERGRNEDRQDVHVRFPIRSAFRQTASELIDMVIAAKIGVTSPKKATGTVTKL